MSGKGVQIPVSANFDSSSVDGASRQLLEQINRIGREIARANRVKFNPVDKASTADLAKVLAQWKEIAKVQDSLRRRLTATGQAGADFTGVDLARVYANPHSRRTVFERTVRGTSLEDRFEDMPSSRPAPPGPPGGGGGGGGSGSRRPPGSYPGRNVVDAGLGAMGPVGGIAGRAIGAGVAGGAAAGLSAFLGPLAAFGVAKLVGSVVSGVTNKIGAAETESIGYDTLKRVLGDVNVQFEHLRGSLRDAANGLGMTYAESLKLGTEFAKISGMQSGQYGSLHNEVRIGAGLGRSFGLDPGQGTGFMATMRRAGVTSDESGSRRLALMIGEAVGKVGFSKADEVLSAVSGFAMNVARTSLTGANTGGYLGALSGMAGSKMPGLDVSGSAGILAAMNSAMVSGGAAGEAGQNLLYAAIGRRLGLDPIRTNMQVQKGMFGTAGNGMTNMQMVMDTLQKSYGHLGPQWVTHAGSRMFGVNERQFAGWQKYGQGSGLSGLDARLAGLGLSMGSINPSAIGAMSAIYTGSDEQLNAQMKALRGIRGKGKLTATETQELDAAMKSGQREEFRDVLLKLTATRDQEMTDGKAARESISHLDNVMTDLATKLIPINETMRDALTAMAGKLAPDSSFAKAAKQDLAYQTRAEILANAAATGESADVTNKKLLGTGIDTGALRFARNGADRFSDAIKQVESGGRRYEADGVTLLRSRDKYGNVVGTAAGEYQVLDSTAKNPGYGIKPAQDDSPEERARVGKELARALLTVFGGDVDKAAYAYNQGPGAASRRLMSPGDPLGQGDSDGDKYVRKVRDAIAAGNGGQGPLRGEATVDITFVAKGKQVGPKQSVPISSKPVASGAESHR